MQEIKLRTKPDEVCAQIREMARRLGGGAKLPTVRELSRSYGVSRMTLNVALNRLEEQQVILRRRGSGLWVSQEMARSSLPRQVALVCNLNFLRSAGHSAFWEMLIEQAQGRAAQKNEACQLHLTSPTGSPEGDLLDSLMAEMSAGRVQGVLGIGLSKPAAQWVIAQGLPLVTFASWSNWFVGFDNDQLVRLAVEELARQGCRRLGLWKPVTPFDTPSGNRESVCHDEATFQAALEAHGLKFHPSLLQHGVGQRTPNVPTGESHQEQGYRIALEVFGQARKLWPDGIVSTDDMMTHGALLALQKLGVRVGSDVKVASHANAGSPTLLARDEELALLEVDAKKLVQTMFDQLETLMDGQVPLQSKVLIAPRLRAPRG